MRALTIQPELAPHERRPPGRADHPARCDLSCLAAQRDGHHVVAVTVGEVRLQHFACAEARDARVEVARGELVLEPATVELVGRSRRPERRPVLRPLGDVGVVPRREPEADTHLRELVLVDVVLEPEDAREVVGADLETRLADLEGRLGRRSLALLRNHDGGLRPRALELKRERQPGQTAPQNRNVVAVLEIPAREFVDHGGARLFAGDGAKQASKCAARRAG